MYTASSGIVEEMDPPQTVYRRTFNSASSSTKPCDATTGCWCKFPNAPCDNKAASGESSDKHNCHVQVVPKELNFNFDTRTFEETRLCVQCGKGKHYDFEAKISLFPQGCRNCTKGKYREASNVYPENECKDCTAGKYQDLEGQAQCKDCAPCGIGEERVDCGGAEGNFGVCKNCTAGKYQDLESHTQCKNCAPCGVGEVRVGCADGNSGECRCLPNMYTNQSVCTDCPPGRFTRFPLGVPQNHLNISDCVPPPRVLNMTPEIPVPNNSNAVSFFGNFNGAVISLTMGLGHWTSITRISSTNITAISPQGITGQLFPLFVIVDGIQALTAFNFSYRAPNITQVISPPFSGGTVQVLGQHFGSVLDQIKISIFGEGACPVPCEETEFIVGGVACQYNAPGKKNLKMNVRLTAGPKGHEQQSNIAGYEYEFDKGTLLGIPEGRQRVSEGANLTYRLSLTIVPKDDNVVVRLTASGCTIVPTVLTFLVNQEEIYSINVGTTNNKVDEGTVIAYSCTVMHTMETTDRQYKDNLPKSLEIDVLNDDEADVKLWTLGNDGTHAYNSKFLSFYMEEGGASNYSIKLDTEPQSNVSVHLNVTLQKAVPHAPKVVAVPPVVEFTPSSWNIHQAIHIKSIADDVDYPLTDFEVLHTVVSEETRAT
eukprot:g261.t1